MVDWQLVKFVHGSKLSYWKQVRFDREPAKSDWKAVRLARGSATLDWKLVAFDLESCTQDWSLGSDRDTLEWIKSVKLDREPARLDCEPVETGL